MDSSTGVFTWRPALEQVNSTNRVTVVVTDDGSPALSDSQSFTIAVRPRPLITSVSLAGDNVTLTWTAIPGTSYRVQHKSSLDQDSWSNLSGEIIADGESGTKSEPIDSAPQRFYRIVVSP